MSLFKHKSQALSTPPTALSWTASASQAHSPQKAGVHTWTWPHFSNSTWSLPSYARSARDNYLNFKLCVQPLALAEPCRKGLTWNHFHNCEVFIWAGVLHVRVLRIFSLSKTPINIVETVSEFCHIFLGKMSLKLVRTYLQF